MKKLLHITLLCFLPGMASGFPLPADKDNITYDLSNHVWLDGRISEHLEFKNEERFFTGIVINSEALPQLPDKVKQDYVIALSLSESFTLNDHALPSVNTLAAVWDEELVTLFLSKYVGLSLSLGVDYILLPETEDLPKPKRLIYEALYQLRPDYFILPSSLARVNKKDNKKAIRQNLLDDKLLLVSSGNGKKITRYLDKLGRENIGLSTFRKRDETPEKPVFTPQMITSVYERSVVYLSDAKNAVPLETKTVGVLLPSATSPLAAELKKYYEVKDISVDIPSSDQVILVDARHGVAAFQPFLQAYKNHRIVALVSGETEGTVEADDYLYFPQNHPIHDTLVPQMLYGALDIKGKYCSLDFLKTKTIQGVNASGKLRYAPPEWEGVSSDIIGAIDTLASEIISTGAAPGLQVTVVRGSSIIYNKSYGFLTYDSLIAVNQNTLYDIASITKVAGTLLAVMNLYDKQQLSLEDSISRFLPQYANTNKQHITIKQLLSHQGGFRSYEPLWKRTLTGDFLNPYSYVSEEAGSTSSVTAASAGSATAAPVSEPATSAGSVDAPSDARFYGIPIHPIMRDSIRNWLIKSPLMKKPHRYRYSDLGFMVLQQVVEAVTQMSIDRYLVENFYEPMGLHYTTFNPLEKGFEAFEIAPTEFDRDYRRELVWGKVHDRNAAIFGGVAGHAGLFSSAKELAVIMQMILNNGFYGGRRYLKPETIEVFNTRYFAGNRRALGWDKYDVKINNASGHVSPESFGHTGFTGSMVWADPSHDLIYTFVSNRIYPNASNRKLQRHRYRSRIQDIIYKALIPPLGGK